MLIADLTHYDGADPNQHPRAWRLTEQLRRIVRAGTATPAGVRLDSALPCPRRPRRRVCPGCVQIVRHEVPSAIQWECSGCGDSGAITGFEGSPYDLRPARARRPEDVAVELMAAELATLRDLHAVDREGERLIWTAGRHDERIWLVGTEEELTALSECVAAEANHEDHRRRQERLDVVLGTLEVALGDVP